MPSLLLKLPDGDSREVKLGLYSRRGVDEYWIVDWQQRTVDVYRQADQTLRLVGTLSGDELIIRIGAYRRHILLPEALRGGAIKATREGEYLIVRRRA